MMNMKNNRYYYMGERAYLNNAARESCRFTSKHTREPWLAGWDSRKAYTDERDAEERVPRWDDDWKGGYSKTRGECPRIQICVETYGEDGYNNVNSHWFVTSQDCGIITARNLGTADMAEAKVRAILRCREHLLKMAGMLDALSDTTS